VATRRLRAAMSIFGPVFPEKQFKPLEKEVARITDALGGVRDADVQIDFMQKAAEAIPEAEKVGLKAFEDHLNSQRDRDRVILIKELNRLEKSKFSKDFDAMLDKLGEDANNG
ncbi:MAG: CHAD domain-containing protein, partial [Capsulimonas sp.]|uniref:CHAD domain-containing protein n=1 Tax=Capsulimonas sp. TaxID=2494211 RepID=UPI003264091D